MKKVMCLLVLVTIFTSCKTKKTMIDASAKAEVISAKKVVKKHEAVNFNKKTVDAKLKANFNNGKINQGLSVNLKIEKDKVIWLKGTKFITVFKAKITPTTVSYYSPFAKNYFEGDFSMIEKVLGVEINFNQLQNLFLGQAVMDLKDEEQNVTVENNTYVLSPEQQALLFDYFAKVSPAHFKLESQTVLNSAKEQRLDVLYPSYKVVEDEVFPSKIQIKAKQKKSFTNVDFEFKSVVFDSELSMPFSIPSGYKRIEI